MYRVFKRNYSILKVVPFSGPFWLFPSLFPTFSWPFYDKAAETNLSLELTFGRLATLICWSTILIYSKISLFVTLASKRGKTFLLTLFTKLQPLADWEGGKVWGNDSHLPTCSSPPLPQYFLTFPGKESKEYKKEILSFFKLYVCWKKLDKNKAVDTYLHKTAL